MAADTTELVDQPVRYGAWTRDRNAWFLGLTGPALVAILLAALPLLVLAGAHQWLAALAWTPVLALTAAGAAIPVKGRPGFRWAAHALARLAGNRAGWSDWQSRAAAGDSASPGEVDLPGVLSGVRTHDGPPVGPASRRPVLVEDDRLQTWAAVAALTHPGIGLAEPTRRAALGAGLAALLEGAATSGLVQTVALQVRTVPDDGAERDAWVHAHQHPAAPAVARAVNADLARAMGAAAVQHEAFLTVLAPEPRLARRAKEYGGGVDGRARALHAAMAQCEDALIGPAGATAVDWLDSPQLAAAIRTGFAPGERAALVTAALTHTHPQEAGARAPGQPGERSAAGLPMAAAGPTAAPPPAVRHYAHDAWLTASCAVLLPDKGAIMGALAPILTPTTPGERRCATVFFEPIAHHQADKMVGGESMSADLAAEIRQRAGFRQRASHRRDAARVDGQDIRLAAGSALVRVAVVAAVTVPNTWPITEHASRLESDITNAGFTALRLDLAQDSGFAAACVPLGVGLPRRRGPR